MSNKLAKNPRECFNEVLSDPYVKDLISEKNMKRLMKAKEQIESGHGTYHDIIEVNEIDILQ